MTDEAAGSRASATDLTIFISYRRSDTRADAGRLYDALRRRFGRDQLFMDVDSLQPGQDWVAAVEAAVAQSDVLLAVIGDEWSTVVDATGKRRIEDDLDRVRLEIEAALKQQKLVIPVLFEDAHMPTAEELPDSLQPLRRRNAMHLAHDTFRYDLEPLVHSLRTIEANKRAKLGLPPKAAAQPAAPEKQAEATPAMPKADPTPLPATPVPPPPAPAPAAFVPPASTQPPAPPYQGVFGSADPAASQQAWPYQQPAAPYAPPSPYAPQAPYVPPSPYGQPPGYSGYGNAGPWPAPTRTGAAANPFSLVAIILGLVAVLFFPILLGPVGIVLGIVGRSRREPWAVAGITVAIVGMIVGLVLGAMAYL